MEIGDSIGAIYSRVNSKSIGCVEWHLIEDTITRIVENSNGKTCHAKSKFYPIKMDVVIENTEMQEKGATNTGLICTGVVFELNDITRPFVENWIKNMNNLSSMV